MTTQHTPGPWAYHREFLCTANVNGTLPLNSKIIAQVTEVTEPNARLIAAAPEMLEILRECRRMLPVEIRDVGQTMQVIEMVREVINAAIRKATEG